MRCVVALTVALAVIVGVFAAPASARSSAPPTTPYGPITVGKDANGDGWYMCNSQVPRLGQRWKWACPVFPAGGTPLAIGGWWKAAKCAAGIVAFIAGNVVAISKIRKAGGVWTVAKKIVKAKNAEARAAAVAAVFGEMVGLTEVIEACGG